MAPSSGYNTNCKNRKVYELRVDAEGQKAFSFCEKAKEYKQLLRFKSDPGRSR